MKLKTYIEINDLVLRDFARSIGVSPVAVSRYMSGQRMPRAEIMESITRVTRGRVGPEDFYPKASRILKRFRSRDGVSDD